MLRIPFLLFHPVHVPTSSQCTSTSIPASLKPRQAGEEEKKKTPSTSLYGLGI